MLHQTIKFALGQMPPKATDDPLKFNKYAMVAADILSSESKVVTTFFMAESTKLATEQAECKPNEIVIANNLAPPKPESHREIKPEGHSSSDDLIRGHDSKEKTQDNKPDLFVIEGHVIRKSTGLGKRRSLHK